VEAFEGGPAAVDFLAAALDATLPGIDANDPSKTLGTIRLYAAVVSNMGRGLHSSTFQLYLSRFWQTIPLDTPGHLMNTPKTTPGYP